MNHARELKIYSNYAYERISIAEARQQLIASQIYDFRVHDVNSSIFVVAEYEGYADF